jgi:hypothetical protein
LQGIKLVDHAIYFLWDLATHDGNVHAEIDKLDGVVPEPLEVLMTTLDQLWGVLLASHYAQQQPSAGGVDGDSCSASDDGNIGSPSKDWGGGSRKGFSGVDNSPSIDHEDEHNLLPNGNGKHHDAHGDDGAPAKAREAVYVLIWRLTYVLKEVSPFKEQRSRLSYVSSVPGGGGLPIGRAEFCSSNQPGIIYASGMSE